MQYVIFIIVIIIFFICFLIYYIHLTRKKYKFILYDNNLNNYIISHNYYESDNNLIQSDYMYNDNINEAELPSTLDNSINKPFLWVYWENRDNANTPDYINLCYESIIKHCDESFRIIKLNEQNIYYYLPQLLENKIDFTNLLLAQKVDYYRILLLYHYGGLYIDADTLVMRNPIEIIEKLKDYDFVGFGCTGDICNYGYGQPSNGIMASRSNGILISRVINNLENKLINQNNKKWNYFDLGKYIIWEELDFLIKHEDYNYYHYSNDYDGTRDIYGNWIETSYLYSNESINYKDEDLLFFIILYNSQMDDLRDMSRAELLESDLNISRFIKKSLNLD